MGGLLIAALLVGVIYFPVRIAADEAARALEIRGAVIVEFCTYHGRGTDSARCVGTFRSDDGALVVEGVSIGFVGAHQDMIRRTSERARLAGPGDSTADAEDQAWIGPAVLWTLDAALFAWLIAQVVWFVRELRRRAAQA
jgi:hypothetical protein